VKRESVWAAERADAVNVVTGRVADDSMLVLVYTLDEGDDPFDEAVWPKANPNLGVSVKIDTLREQAEKAKRSPGLFAAFLRFRMNVATTVGTRAISIDEWDACSGLLERDDGSVETFADWQARVFPDARPPADDEAAALVVHPPGSGAYAGLDLASVKDLTALVLLFRDGEGTYRTLCRFWCPADGVAERSRADGVPYEDWVRDGYLVATPGNVTDYEFVRAELEALSQRFTIGQIAYDAWNATQLALELMQDGAAVIPVHQSHAGLAPAWRELMKLILERKIEHGGHPILRWMAGNVEEELDAAGNAKPSKRLSAEKIDGMVALDMALGRWMAHGQAQRWTAA
jgi:phage terminase large subunit-like protein